MLGHESSRAPERLDGLLRRRDSPEANVDLQAPQQAGEFRRVALREEENGLADPDDPRPVHKPLFLPPFPIRCDSGPAEYDLTHARRGGPGTPGHVVREKESLGSPVSFDGHGPVNCIATAI